MADERRCNRRVSAAAGAVVAAVLLSASAAPADARPAGVVRQPIGAEQAPVATPVLESRPTISGDGRFLVFQGRPPGADPAQPEGQRTTTFLRDRDDNTTVELTPVPAGLRPGNSVHPVISGDGCTVVVTTEMALDLFRDDDGGTRWDVYRTTLPHCDGVLGDWELVSTQPDGTLARDDVTPDEPVALTRSGTLLAYTHPADYAALADDADVTAITVVDLTVPVDDPARSRVAAGMPSDVPNTTFVHVGMDQPAFSADGRFLAYRSDTTASEAVPGWGPGRVGGERATQQVFVWDRQEADPFAAVRLVSALPDGRPAPAGASEPALSRDGRVVAFISRDAGLVPAVFPPCADQCPSQVYHLDRDTDENGWYDEPGSTALSLVSAQPGTSPLVAGTAPSSQPALDASGSQVAFVTKAQNLQVIPAPVGGEGADGDLLVWSSRNDTLRRVTTDVDGVRPAVGAHARPQLSDNGRTTAFDTLAAAQVLPWGAPPGRQVVALAAPPALSLADADLGTTIVGLESDEWYVAVINDGPSAFQPASVRVSDPRFVVNEEVSTCTLGASVPPGGDCTVMLTFRPTGPGAVDATLTVAEEGFDAVSVSSRVSGAGGEPALRSDPAGADLGRVDVGRTGEEFLFDVENISVVPTSVTSVRVTGSHADEFVVSTNNCANRPLNPRASCSVGVTFTPAGAGRRTAVVEVATPSGQYTSVVLAGDAAYRPEVMLLTNEVTAGRELAAAGRGYPANSEVTIVLGDGAGRAITTTTDDNGEFLLWVPVPPTEQGGPTNLVVQSGSEAVAAQPIEVIAEPQQYVGLPGFGLGR